ncbi:MAG: pilus assembly protein TadG-related protein [Acidimicrobiia bacterium]|nr:pilus assembly protein TadG-related protein [Acidimicrobiia bacterium]
MRWLTDESGATIVLAAAAMVGVLALAGLAVDLGAAYVERRELVSGADAAVLAVAEDCATSSSACAAATAKETALRYARDNASDGAAGVDFVDLDRVGRSVRVGVSTLNPDGTTIVPRYFSRVVGWEGVTVRAEATARWGFPSSLRSTIPLIISDCEFPANEPLPTAERVIYFHDGNSTEPCNATAGMDSDGDGKLAGGFGWLVTDGVCAVDLAIGAWESDDPGASPSNGCTPDLIWDLLGEPVPLPFFDDLTGVGANGRYHVGGFGYFHITGFNFGSHYKAPSAATAPCSGDERCVSGYFTTGVIYEGELGGPDHGLRLVELVE